MNRRESAFRWSVALAIFATTLWGPTVSAQTFKVIYNFGGPSVTGVVPQDGANPYAGMVFDTQGNLYGTTMSGGILGCGGVIGCGTVFQLTPNNGTWKENVLHIFRSGAEGGWPLTPVIFDGQGNLYGSFSCVFACFYGNYAGGVFQLVPTSHGNWTEYVLSNFGNGECQSSCGVAFDHAGNLYGTTDDYVKSAGAVFRLGHLSVHSGWIESVLYKFTGDNDGGYPYSAITFDVGNTLYSTTLDGGSTQEGTVFQLQKNQQGSGWTETVLYTFQGGSDGATPYGGVIFDTAGNLYGTTTLGGTSGAGTVFELTPGPDGSWNETVLYSFQGGSDAYNPTGPLIFDMAGDLYGVAGGGAYGHGAIFKLNPSTGGHWTESILYSFTGGLDGDSPSDGLVLDPAGNLYGTTINGGRYPTCNDEPYCGGVAYEITP